MNKAGEAEWSPIGVIQAARTPYAPFAPKYKSSTNESITLTLNKFADNGGSSIT